MLKVYSIYQKMMQLKCCFYWQQSVALDGASLIFCCDPLKVADHNDWWLHCTLPMSHTYTQTNQGNQKAAMCSSFHYEEHRVWHWSIPRPKEMSNPHGFLTTFKMEWVFMFMLWTFCRDFVLHQSFNFNMFLNF